MQNIADNFLNTYLSRFYQGVEGNIIIYFPPKVCSKTFSLHITHVVSDEILAICLQISWIPLLCITNEERLHHLLRGRENMWTNLCTRL